MTKSSLKTSITCLLSAIALQALPAAAQSQSTTVTETTTVRESAPVTSVETVTTTDRPASTRTETRWHTEEKTIARPGTRVYAPFDFDINQDKIITFGEIGEKLFKMYDEDGNLVIDNNEYERRAVLTVAPVEKNTTVSYDTDGDGVADRISQTTEVFMQESHLARFDPNGDGLSPREFTGRTFREADINRDRGVDLSEWKGSYIAALDQRNKSKALSTK